MSNNNKWQKPGQQGQTNHGGQSQWKKPEDEQSKKAHERSETEKYSGQKKSHEGSWKKDTQATEKQKWNGHKKETEDEE